MTQHEIKEVFGNNIRTLRRNRGLNQAQYASLLFVNGKNIGSWEEYRAMPSMETLLILSKLENKSIEELVTKPVVDRRNILAVDR